MTLIPVYAGATVFAIGSGVLAYLSRKDRHISSLYALAGVMSAVDAYHSIGGMGGGWDWWSLAFGTFCLAAAIAASKNDETTTAYIWATIAGVYLAIGIFAEVEVFA